MHIDGRSRSRNRVAAVTFCSDSPDHGAPPIVSLLQIVDAKAKLKAAGALGLHKQLVTATREAAAATTRAATARANAEAERDALIAQLGSLAAERDALAADVAAALAAKQAAANALLGARRELTMESLELESVRARAARAGVHAEDVEAEAAADGSYADRTSPSAQSSLQLLPFVPRSRSAATALAAAAAAAATGPSSSSSGSTTAAASALSFSPSALLASRSTLTAMPSERLFDGADAVPGTASTEAGSAQDAAGITQLHQQQHQQQHRAAPTASRAPSDLKMLVLASGPDGAGSAAAAAGARLSADSMPARQAPQVSRDPIATSGVVEGGNGVSTSAHLQSILHGLHSVAIAATVPTSTSHPMPAGAPARGSVGDGDADTSAVLRRRLVDLQRSAAALQAAMAGP